MCLGGDGKHAAAVERDRAVVEPAVERQRRADRESEVPRRGLAGEPRQRLEHSLEQWLLEEEVAARVGRQAELREHGVLCPLGMRMRQGAQVRLGVEGGVGDAHLRDAHRDACEAVVPDVEEGVGHASSMIPCRPTSPKSLMATPGEGAARRRARGAARPTRGRRGRRR